MPVTEPSRAVLLSYASEDEESAQRICEALGAAGIEVWFDKSESAYQIAEVYALCNDAKATFEWLDRAWNNRDSGIQYLLFDPFILRYKDDPRFAAFCREVGLPVPGEATAHRSS